MQTGKYNILKVVRRTDNGLYLEDEEQHEVLLPNRFVTENMKEGTLGKVFVYKDSEDRIVATTQTPFVAVDEVALLEVNSVTDIGAFLSWGLDKDLLLPYSEQKGRVRKGEKVFVFVYLDRATDRICATANLNKFLKNREVKLKVNDEVNLLIGPKTEIGFRVVINNMHWGMIYNKEIFSPVREGEKHKGYVKKIREDGKLDCALQKQGIAASNDASEIILRKLKENNGKLTISDNSSPEEIYAMLGFSKKIFKRAAGILFKKGEVDLLESGIVLRKKL